MYFCQIAQDMYDNATTEQLVQNIPELQDLEKSELEER